MLKPAQSIHALTRRYLGGLLLIIALTTLTLVFFGHSLLDKNAAKEEATQRKLIANNLGEVIAFYQAMVDELAKQQDIQDIIAFGDVASAERWAHQMRLLMPESIGVALIGVGSMIMGEPLTLRLGPACVNDVQRTLQDESIARPPVHREVEALAHFDVSSPVRDHAGNTIGLVFASFRLDLLQRHIDRLSTRGALLIVEDTQGSILAQTPTHNGVQDHHANGHLWEAIPNTDWQLHLMLPRSALDPVLIIIAIGGVMIFFLGSGIITVLVEHLFKAFTQDIRLIQSHLVGVRQGDLDERLLSSRFAETRKIVDDIGAIVSDIGYYQRQLAELSITDELTGLLNRRGFLQRLDDTLRLSERQISSILVLFDLDHFKECNDRYGHALGDEVLRAFAHALRERCRSTDLCARIGGDEFAVVLINWQHHEVDNWYRTVAELFWQAQQSLLSDSVPELRCTPSAGAVTLDGRFASSAMALQAADAQLYLIKHGGRGAIAFDRPLA